MRVYISEDEFFTDFNNSKSLFWELEHLEYGDWEMGDNGDGSFVHSGHIEATEVGSFMHTGHKDQNTFFLTGATLQKSSFHQVLLWGLFLDSTGAIL